MTETPHPDPDSPESGETDEPSAQPEPADAEPEGVAATEDVNETPLPAVEALGTSEPDLQAPPYAYSEDTDGDAAQIVESPEPHGEHAPVDRALIDWASECSPRTVAVELKRVEEHVRQLLEDRDSRRKRKLAGSRRWAELHEDILSWRHAGRMDEQVLRDLERLVSRRHYLFRRLSYLAGTRPTWNS